MAVSRIDASICERLITAATSHCGPVSAVPPAPTVITTHEPNWEGVTLALTHLGTAISYGMFVLAVIGLLGLIGFAYFVRLWAQQEAKAAAEKWFDEEAPAVLATLLGEPLNKKNDTISNATAASADNIANAAG